MTTALLPKAPGAGVEEPTTDCGCRECRSKQGSGREDEGLDDRLRIRVSQVYSARTDAGRLVYELHGRSLRPRPGTVVPSEDHLAWHDREVFKGCALAA